MRGLAKAPSAAPTSGTGATRGRTSLISLAIAAVSLLTLAPMAQANIITDFFGSEGSGDGQFQNPFQSPGGVAVNNATGQVYVVDPGNHRVQRLSAAGAFVNAFGSQGTGDGQFEFTDAAAGIAIDQSDGSLYVVDVGNNRVQKFQADGTFLDSFGSPGNGDGQFNFASQAAGIAVDPAAPHDVFVTDRGNNRVQRFDSAGTFEKAWGEEGGAAGQFFAPSRVAVDTAGNVYVLDFGPSFTGQIQRFDTEGAFEALFGAAVLTNSPSQIAVDPSDDHVYVVQADSSFSEQNVVELKPDGTLEATHGAGNKTLFGAAGLAVRSGGEPIYVSSSSQTRVAILAEADAPTAMIDPASGIDAASATLNGKVNPGGARTTHRFEYVPDAQFQIDGFAKATLLPDQDSGIGDSAAPVIFAVSGLKSSTLYHVRLFAKHRYSTASTTSGETTFTTAAAKPTIAPTASADVTETTATLGSRVTPNGQATTYFFEWGPTATYGNATPAQGAGSGSESVFASAELTDLAPNTTYHFRLVASNGLGTSQGVDHLFTTAAPAPSGPCPNAAFRTGPGANLPECRAYEQVSPTNKNGGDILWEGVGPVGARTVAIDGNRALFVALTEFAGANSGGSFAETTYLARRSGGSWQTAAMIPRVTPPAASAGVRLSTPDLARSLLGSQGVLNSSPPDTLDESENMYLRDNVTGVVRPYLATSYPFGQPMVSPEMDRVVFGSQSILTADPGVPPTLFTKVYEKVGDQPVRLVSVKPDGTPFSGEAHAFPAGASNNSTFPYSTVGGISDNGRHIFFTVEDSIWRRSDGATTILASPSKRSEPDPAGIRAKQFHYATPDGNRVLFSSGQLLTDDANTGPGPFRPGGDLYRYDIEDDELIDISATPGGNGAEVLGVVGFDEGAERIYYVGAGQVVPGKGTPGQPNLYLWEDDGSADGSTRFIASLLPRIPVGSSFIAGDSFNWFRFDGDWTARTTADGRYLLFESEAPIPGHDSGGVRQVYRYDAEENGGAGQLDCVSCNPEGQTPIGPSFVTRHAQNQEVQQWELPRGLTADGRVFFTTTDGLLPQDTNSLKDAYTWKDGELHLLSTGTSNRDSFFYNASVDGKDAFILTPDALVPQDGDDLTDLYTAHVNGGLASQFATPPPDCSGEECRNAGTQPPAGPPPLTPSLQGPGNATSKPSKGRCPKGKRRVKARNGNTRCVKKQSAKRKSKQNRASNDRRVSR